MINKIVMSNINSYKERTELSVDKSVVLVYGLNGTGKSTLSNYLYDINNLKYKDCSVEGLSDNEEILVYNQQFVNENFYETDSIKGIFTLSKENKKAKQAIENANADIEKINEAIRIKNDELANLKKQFDKSKKSAEEKIWEIKTKYTGGDRVLEYCLKDLKSSKSKLFAYIAAFMKQENKPEQDIESIKTEVKSLGEAENKLFQFSPIAIDANDIEKALIFTKNIVGNKDSIVSQLIDELSNSDWVKSGLSYINLNDKKTIQICPFCQSKTITTELIDGILGFFDETYEKDVNEVQSYAGKYGHIYESIQNLVWEKNAALEEEDILKLQSAYKNLLSIMEKNLQLMKEKLLMPSKIIEINKTDSTLKDINDYIKIINNKIQKYNDKIENKEENLKKLKQEFWKNMRWEYNNVIESFFEEKSEYEKECKKINESINNLQLENKKKKSIIVSEQKKTINIDEAIDNINCGLLEIGVTDFKIVKAIDEENVYKIVRGDDKINVFKSLSEGEKMLISFLYFIELCRGKKSVSETINKKIVVIDDPITSMSHIYVFNVGRMIHNEFLRNEKYEQVFIMTHSLYFFYELTCMGKQDRDERQVLVRISKDKNGSKFLDMRYQEIQNDYQAYWSIIKDNEQPPALIANCIRNIIEYFFNFVENIELSNVFQKPIFQSTKYQAFYRYINRESHSLGQNIIDFKEFNYDDFKEAFRLVFFEAGYDKHYKKMMKQKK